MLKSILTPAIATLLLAGTAMAASPTGQDQLARSAGVASGQYTATELVNIIEARRDNDTATLDFYLSGKNRAPLSHATEGTEQLARIAGVASGQYTTAELVRIIEAQRDGDESTLAFILSGQNRTEGNAASVVTPGEAMLAGSAGVDASQYTLNELIAMQAEIDN